MRCIRPLPHWRGRIKGRNSQSLHTVVDSAQYAYHGIHMMEIVQSATFANWLSGLRDDRARVLILTRLDRLATGNPGDVKPVGAGISEMRIAYGPGYRLYYLQDGKVIAVMLCGGDKSSQRVDIAKAKRLAKEWRA